MQPYDLTRLALDNNSYYHDHGVCPADLTNARWQKSSFSLANGNCVDVARLRPDRIGIRDTKDHSQGPVLIFTQEEWAAFLAGARTGDFDSI